MTLEYPRPKRARTDEVVRSGYSPTDFDDDYWLAPGAGGRRRIDREATTLISFVQRLQQRGLLAAKPRIVDVGAGAGNQVNALRKAGLDCEGCEFSPSGRRLAKAHFGIDLEACDLRERLPYRDATFDLAVCIGVLTMIPVALASNACHELARITRGLLLVLLIRPKPVAHEPHLNDISYIRWHSLLGAAGLDEVTAVCAPQCSGLGVVGEFCGLFRKRV